MNVSDRPLLDLIELSHGLYATCGTSHSVYVFGTRVLQDLYTKEFGHKDWVTSIVYCGDLYSAGMDGHICRWFRLGNRFSPGNVAFYQGPISKLKADEMNRIWASSYDGTLCVYDRHLSLLYKISVGNPIIDFSLSNGIVFGDKKGVLYKAHISGVMDQLQAHQGPFSLYQYDKVWTVGREGFVRCFDFELSKEKGRRLFNQSLSPVYCSAGGDHCILIVHHQGISVVNPITKLYQSIPCDTNPPSLQQVAYCCTIAEGVGYIGWGDGSVTSIELKTMKQKRHRTMLKNAIRSILVSDRILLSGDDGQIVDLPKLHE
jgi:WD40 repeat protein